MQSHDELQSFRLGLDEAFDAHPERLPKHKIFISHSGKQKDFAEQLYKDLEAWNYYPFFDKRSHSLPKGQHFPTLIFEAARECFMAIVLLSSDFVVSKWPMMELDAIVQAQKVQLAQKDYRRVHILPVLLGRLQPHDLQNTARWSKHWRKWAERVNFSQWESALKGLIPVNMFLQSNYDGEVALRSEIVNSVLSLMPPNVRFYVSHVQGKERFCKEITARFSEVGISHSRLCKNAKVLGLYGITGAGKSTMCMILANSLRRDFLGRTCHVEFGEEQRDQYGLLKIQHQVLKQLTEVNQDYSQIHIDHEAKGWTCLKERMPKQQVFLALDNISERNRDVAKDFLYGFEYHVNSIVLVTSRSKDVLEKLGIPERCCMHCPCVTAEEGLKIVLNHVGLNNIEVLSKEQRHIIQKTVEMCNFGGQLHPMALNVLAAQLGMNPSSWKLSALDFSEASDREHKLFTEMEAIVLGLPDQQTRDMFMDIALFTPETVHNVYELCLWLQDTSYITLEHVRKKLNVLRLKSLLEVWSLDCDNICIHDLHRELAKRRTQVGTDALRFIYQTSGEFDPSILEQMERACFVCNSCTKLTLDRCPRLKLLSARSCHSLVEVELQGLTRLVSLELSVCPVETLDLKGLNKLRWLCLTSCECLKKLDASRCEALLCVRVSKCNELEGLEIKNSKLLKSVSVSYNNCLKVVDLGNGNCLRRLAVWFCEKLRDVKMSESVELHEFKKRGCRMLLNLHGCKKIMSQKASCLIVTRWHRISKELITALQASRCLQVLDLWECPMSRLPDLRNCSSLRELKLSEVDVLLDSNDSALLHEYVDILCASNDRIALPPSLQEVTIRNCRKTVVREICWKLHGLENIVVLLMQTVRVCWGWELYRSSTNPFSDQTWYLNNSEWDVENRADFLHQKIGNIEPEETSDVEQSCSNDECAKETSSVERIALDTSAFVSNRCEKHSDFIKLLSTVLYWIREFLGDKGIQSQVKDIITTGWQKPVQLSLGELYIQDIGGWWGRLLMSDEMRKVHYRSPDYVLLEFFDNFETLQKLFRETAINKATGNLGKTLDKLKMQTVEQLRQQLCVLRALVRGESCSHDCEPWEQRVMDEIILFEYIVTSSDLEQAHEVMWEKLAEDWSMFSPWRLTELEETLRCLMVRRLWSVDDTVQVDYSGQWKQDWLKSCKVCMSMQVLCVFLNQEYLQEFPSHRQWLSEMTQEINCLVRSEIEKLLISSTSIVDDDEMKDLISAWKAWQWLQKLALSFSKKCMEEDIRETLASSSEGELGFQTQRTLITPLEVQTTEALLDVVEEGCSRNLEDKKFGRNFKDALTKLLLPGHSCLPKEKMDLQAKLTSIDVVGILIEALQRWRIQIPAEAEWEANNLWLHKYRIIENAIRQEGIKWAGFSLHPSNNWKEAALHDLCNQAQAWAYIVVPDDINDKRLECIAVVIELLEGARVQKQIHDMVVRLQLNPSVNIEYDACDHFLLRGIHRLERSGIRSVKKINLNLFVTRYLEIQMADRLTDVLCLLRDINPVEVPLILKGQFVRAMIIKFNKVNAMMSSRIDDLKGSPHKGLQAWAKAEKFPLRSAWKTLNPSNLQIARLFKESKPEYKAYFSKKL